MVRYYGVEINAITLAVAEMDRAVHFYGSILGLGVVYGGADSEFTTFEFGTNFINVFVHTQPEGAATSGVFWGRVVFHVDDPDEVYDTLVSAGISPEFEPRDAPWGERYFHVNDPDGHELSFARPL